MAFEMPVDLINNLKTLLRKEANLSWYQPEKEENLPLPKLSPVAETVAKLDPSPPYLRCKNCNGRFLLGVQSFICVFCGTNPHIDLPPEPIKFKNTLSYRWLLESLNLDGSVLSISPLPFAHIALQEMVTPMAEENASYKGRSEEKDEIPLSELLDLEIRWPSEAERRLSSNSDSAGFPRKSSLDFAGVDLDGFFDRKESDSDVSEQNLASGGKAGAASDNTFQANENLSLFQNAQASEASAVSVEDQDDDSFSGWEANFKSASSGPVHQESESVDHSKVELDALSGYWKDSVGVGKSDDFNPSASNEEDWFQGGEWRTSKSEVHSQSRKTETTMDLNHTKTTEIGNVSSTRNLDWVQDNQWQGTQNKTPDLVADDEAEDSSDAWNDFTGSVSTQDPSGMISSSNITNQPGNFGFSADLNDIKTVESTNNAFNVDFDSSINDQLGKSEFSSDLNDTKTEGASSSSNKDFDWMQDDGWKDNNSKVTDNIITNEATDSFDEWNDFTGTATTSHGVSNSEITGQSGKFELTKDPNDAKLVDSVISSSSNFDWMQNDLWQGSNNKATGIVTTNEVTDSFDEWNDFPGSAILQNPSRSVSHSDITGQTGISEITADLNETKTAQEVSASSVKTFDWMETDQWLVSNNKTTDTTTTNDIGNSFDAWSGLTSLTSSQDPFSNVPKQIVNQTHFEKAFEMNLFSTSKNSRDMDFSGFSQHDFFKQYNNPLSTPAATMVRPAAASLDRVADMDTARDVPTAEVGSKDDAEMLMSQIHDLSFMLENSLSFPPK